MKSLHPSILQYREWLLERTGARVLNAPKTWHEKMTTEGSALNLSFVGRRVVREINARPIADGAEIWEPRGT